VQALWQSVLGELELSIPHASFTTWFRPTELLEVSDELVTIAVPNTFAIQQFKVRYDKDVRKMLEKNGLSPKQINYVVNTKSKKAIVSRETTKNSPSSARIDQLITPSHRSRSNYSGNKSNTVSLNPRYTFKNFIVGSSNDLAYTACQAAAANPGTKYNPLFLYGGVGLGKTHLMQAVGHEIIKNDPNARVLYISTETFISDFLEHIRFKKTGFGDKYRNVDVLIIDDMQFIAGKEKTQEEFFHTFNELHQNNKQIIISSDKPPKSIPTLTERLRSRFEWGMAIDIQMPDFETRCAIVETKASMSGTELNRDVIEFLAQNIKTNVRELEGALNQLLAYAEMRGVDPDVGIAEGLISNTRATRPQHITPKQIVDKTARYFGLSTAEVCSPKRNKHIALPRQIAMYLLRSELHLSFPVIANNLGRKDHTTAMHSVDKIEKSLKLDQTIREQINEIRDRLYA
jgi:chromosomal replication initiator protein